MKAFFKILKFLAELVILLAAGFIMLYVTYYFGWAMLPEGKTFGNDIPSAMNNLYYLERWYPPIPRWVHLWAGGMPFLQPYPILPFLSTFFLHKWFALTIYQAVKLVMFFSLPLTATGIAVLGRILTKNWWVGILAGVLMLLSPDSWLWITYGGFYAAAFSVPFFAWALVFFSLAWEKRNFWLSILTAIFYGLTWLAHPMAGTLVTISMVILGFGFGVKLYGWKGSWKGVARTLAIGFLGIALFAWWIFPFLTREEIGGIGLGAEQMYKVTLRELLGLDLPVDIIYITSTFFPASWWILFVLGALAAFARRSILRWAVLACGVALFIMTAPYYAQPIVKAFEIFWAATNVRTGLILRILGPIIAAFGAVSLARPIFWLIEHLSQGLKTNKLWQYSEATIGGALGIVVFWVILQTAIIIPPFEQKNSRWLYDGYGPLRNWFRIKEVNGQPMVVKVDWPVEEYEPLFKKPRQILSELPKIPSLTGEAKALLDEKIKLMIKSAGVTEKDRLDISPMEGGLIGVLGNFTQVSQIQAYLGTSLVQRMIGWEIDCVYYNNLCGPKQIADLYRWFGISQVWLGGDELTPTSQSSKARFDKLDLLTPERFFLGEIDRSASYFNIYHFQDKTGLASITNKPAILVIGDNPPNNDVFDIVFRGLSKVNFGYKDAWSVKGKRFIDDYQLKELSQFEVVVLYGYQYHNRNKAWNLLERYVDQGGKLFVDTGWQYMSEDWGREEKGKILTLDMPKILPVAKTIWAKVEDGWSLNLPPNQMTEGVNLTDWGEPLWQGKPWGVAYSKKEDLKDGATSLLENEGKILASSWQYGKGKVVWTGFDFWGHLVSYKAEDERVFVQNTLRWLVGGNYSETKLDFDRKTPDLITINFKTEDGKNKLLFKEVASDNWRADLVTGGQIQNLPIYKAGPGWKMVFLPKEVTAGQIVFSFHRNKIGWIGLWVSIISFLIVLTIPVSKLINKDWDKKLVEKLKMNLQKRKEKMKKNWESEDE